MNADKRTGMFFMIKDFRSKKIQGVVGVAILMKKTGRCK